MSPCKFLLPAIFFSAVPGLLAQNTVTTETTTTSQPVVAAQAPEVVRTRQAAGDKIVMSNGALTEIKGSMGTRIDLDTVLPTGARITPGGTIYLSDGTSTTLKDGQVIAMDGRISPAGPEVLAIAN